MPLQSAAAALIRRGDLAYAPGKACNAGGVAISGLEMSQNAHRRYQSAEAIDRELRTLMRGIHDRIVEEEGAGSRIDYKRGANVVAYRRVAQAIAAMGAG